MSHIKGELRLDEFEHFTNMVVNGGTIGQIFGRSQKDNAHRFKFCWNTHDKLVEQRDALEKALRERTEERDDATSVIEARTKQRDALLAVCEKGAEWMLWIKMREKCTCEPNQRCIKCIVTEKLEAVESAIAASKETA